jgi:hypothetical protein
VTKGRGMVSGGQKGYGYLSPKENQTILFDMHNDQDVKKMAI